MAKTVSFNAYVKMEQHVTTLTVCVSVQMAIQETFVIHHVLKANGDHTVSTTVLVRMEQLA